MGRKKKLAKKGVLSVLGLLFVVPFQKKFLKFVFFFVLFGNKREKKVNVEKNLLGSF